MPQCSRILAVVGALGFLTLAASASAQTGAVSGIAGIVKDTSGAVLPGVTVEAASPALIEKVRTVVTDEAGQYKFVDLRPGTYSVTFSLTGFQTVKREGIELAVNFTAPVNIEMAIGSLSETVTVSGAAPVVDVQNTTVRNVIAAEALNALPLSKTMLSLVAVTPGMAMNGAQQDVGGTKGDLQMFMTFHGSNTSDSKLRLNGFDINIGGGFGRAFLANPMVQEIAVELGGGSSEMATGGIQMNYISKAGGNKVSGDLVGSFTNNSLQGTNLSSDLQARGLTASTMNRIDKIWDSNFGVGGPVQQDRLWFFATARAYRTSNFVAGMYYNKTPNTPFFTPDTSKPALADWDGKQAALRLTWQASAKNKFSEYIDWVGRCDCHHVQNPAQSQALTAPEATDYQIFKPEVVWQTEWTMPATNKLLFTGGVQFMWNNISFGYPPEQTAAAVSITEDTTGLVYGAEAGNFYTHSFRNKMEPRFAVQYVTGSHAFKAGFNLMREWGTRTDVLGPPSQMLWTFHNGQPVTITEYATPYTTADHLKADLGLFAQDQWTIKRLTLNGGLRWDYINLEVPALHLPPTRFRLNAVDTPAVSCTPCQSDLSPRVSASYDVFGTGKTAVKVAVGKYMLARSGVLFAPATSIGTNASRQWTDGNGDFVPGCDLVDTAQNGECGAMSVTNFGKVNILTNWADDTLNNFRKYNWQFSTSVQQELMPRASVNVGFFRTSWYNYTVTDNLLTGPSDYTPYCVPLPTDSRLPSGVSGSTLCGLYDVTPTQFGRQQNLVVRASNFGTQTNVFTGVDVGINVRLPHGGFITGGTSTGRQELNNCYAANDPSLITEGFVGLAFGGTALTNNPAGFCDVKPPFQTQAKLQGSYPLPWDLQASATFQHIPGIAISASYVAPNASVVPSLGRNLAGNVSSVTIANIIMPATLFEDPLNQVDLRLTKIFKLGNGRRFQANVDLYNALNASPILQENTRYGASWTKPTLTLDARFVKIGGQFSF